jgi:hypothetical protein
MHNPCARPLCLPAIPGPFHPPSLLSVLRTEGAFGSSSLNLEPPLLCYRFSHHKILWHLVLYFGQVWFLCGSTWTRMQSLWCSQSLVWYSYYYYYYYYHRHLRVLSAGLWSFGTSAVSAWQFRTPPLFFGLHFFFPIVNSHCLKWESHSKFWIWSAKDSLPWSCFAPLCLAPHLNRISNPNHNRASLMCPSWRCYVPVCMVVIQQISCD